MKKCINYDLNGGTNKGAAWTEEPSEFRAAGCIGCSTHYNDLIVGNNGTEEYVEEIGNLMTE